MEFDSEGECSVGEPSTALDEYTQLDHDPLGYNPQLQNTHYDPELRDDRLHNKKKLKRRFEHIFDKYEQDFEGIGDEIDLKTGEIVVDNGHLKGMQNEHDVGKQAQVDVVDPSLQATGDHLHIDTPEQHNASHLDIPGDASDGGMSDDEESSFEEGDNDIFSALEDNADSDTSPFDADESALERQLTKAAYGTSRIDPTVLRGRSPSEASGISNATRHSTSPQNDGDILDQVPGLKDSMLNLQSQYKRGETVDPDAIQALGMSIANQLANFISQPVKDKSCRSLKRSRDSTWNDPGLLEGSSRKRRPRSPSLEPEAMEPSPSGRKSIWAPIRHPRQQKRRRMKDRESTLPLPDNENASEDETPVHFANRTQDGRLRKCVNCESSESDVWRRGPNGELCNTCGMYLYRYGLMRPLDTATDPVTPEDTEEDMDPLERDWWLAAASAHSTERKEIIKPIGVRNSHFVVEEDALIIQLKEIDLLSWERMATYFPGRSAYALQCRYSKKLHGRAPDARNILLEQGYKGTPDANGIPIFSYTREPFKDEEDELLLKLRDEDGLDFDTVAESFHGRSPEVLEIRYNELLKELLGSRANVSGSNTKQRRASREGSSPLARNARYSAEEDAKIVKLREVDKLNWAKVAENMEGRNSFSLQKRYIRELCGRHPDSTLAPRKAYDRTTPILDATRLDGEISDSSVDLGQSRDTRYSAEEDALLLELRDTQGLTWEAIDPKMPGRSRASIKNRFKHLQDRRQTQDRTLAESGGDLSPSSQLIGAVNDLVCQAKGLDVTLGAHCESQLTRMEDDGEHSTTLIETAPGQSFNKDEDDLILKLRDLESLPWPDIALQLPGKTVSSISERYFHSLVPQKLNAASAAGSSRRTKGTPLKRWTEAEDELLLQLRQQGKTWEYIADQLPGRTWKAVRVHYGALSDGPKKAPRSRQSLPSTIPIDDEAPLLRKAVNNLRRRSESALSPVAAGFPLVDNSADTEPHPDKTGDTQLPTELPLRSDSVNIQAFDDQPPGIHNTRYQRSSTAIPQSGTSHHEIDASNSAHLESNETPRTRSQHYLQTPFTQAQSVRQSSEPTPVVTAFYATPARYNPHGLPYFVHLPAAYPLDPPAEPNVPGTQPEKLTAAKSVAAYSAAKKRQTDKKQSRPKAVKKSQNKPPSHPRKKQTKATANSKNLHSRSISAIDDDLTNDNPSAADSDHESWHESQNESDSEIDESDDGESETEMLRPTMTVDPDNPDDELTIDISFTDSINESASHLSATEADNQQLPSVAQLSQLAGAAPEKPKFSLAKVTAHRRKRDAGKAVQPRSEDAKSVSRPTPRPTRLKTFDITYVKAHPDESFHHRGNGRWARGLPPANDVSESLNETHSQSQVDVEGSEDVVMHRPVSQSLDSSGLLQGKDDDAVDGDAITRNLQSDSTGHAQRPNISNVRLIVMALESKAPEPMLLPEIYKFVEDKFEYFKDSTSYRNSIRASLSSRPQFKKASSANRTGWVLADPPTAVEASFTSAADSSSSAPIPQTEPSINTEIESARNIGTEENDNTNSLRVDSCDIQAKAHGLSQSSPTGLVKKTSNFFSQFVPKRLSGRVTATKSDPPAGIGAHRRVSSVAELANGKRVVRTSMRETEGSEDELA